MRPNPRRRRVGRLAVWTVVLACGATARTGRAHGDSDATIELIMDGHRLRGSWQAALRDLDHAIDLDADGDGTLTRVEWNGRREEAARFVRRHLGCSIQGRPLCLEFGAWSLPMSLQGRAARIEFTADLPPEVSGFVLEYTAFFDGDPWHRGHATLTRSDGSKAQVMLTPDRRRWSLDPSVRGAEMRGASRAGLPWMGWGALAVSIVLTIGRALGLRLRTCQPVS